MATTPRRMMTSQEHAASLRAHPLPPPPPHFYPWLATGTLAAYLRHYATDDPEMRAILEPAHAAMAALEARRRAALRAEGPAMREELLPYVGRRLAVVGTVARFGCKPRFADLYERTVLLTDVRMIDGTPITDHVWFTMGARLAAADPHRGDVLAQQVREIHQTVQAALRPNAPYSPLDPTWGGWGMQLLEDDARDAALYAREALALERVYRLRTARAPLARFRYCQDPPHAGGGVCPGGRGSGGPGGPRRRPDVLPAAGGMMDKQIIPVGAGQRDPRTFLIREWRVLYAIGAHQERHGAGPTWSALGRAEGLGPSSLRRVLARLEREGEIARAPHTTHGLMLTAQGRASYATLRGMLGRALCQAVEKERAAMEAAE